jgi:drug/metabolite transporter (DMT)-like permease
LSLLLSGTSYALLTALSWAVAVVLFKLSGDRMQPTALNYFKNIVGLALLLVTFPFMAEPLFPAVPDEDFVLLLVSGALGIGLADTMLFHSLNILGATRSAIVSCLYSPCVVLISFLMLGERLTLLGGVGAVLVVLGILLAGMQQRDGTVAAPRLIEGIVLGVLATVLMGVAIVMVKPVLEVHSVLWSTTVRMTGGVAVLTLFAGVSRTVRQQVLQAFRPAGVWKFAVPGAVIGTYIALLLWIAGFKYAQANVVSILNQTSALWTAVLAAVFLQERLTGTRIAAIAVGFVGSVLVLL